MDDAHWFVAKLMDSLNNVNNNIYIYNDIYKHTHRYIYILYTDTEYIHIYTYKYN